MDAVTASLLASVGGPLLATLLTIAGVRVSIRVLERSFEKLETRVASEMSGTEQRMTSRIEVVSSTLQRFGERLGTLERDVEVLKDRQRRETQRGTAA